MFTSKIILFLLQKFNFLIVFFSKGERLPSLKVVALCTKLTDLDRQILFTDFRPSIPYSSSTSAALP